MGLLGRILGRREKLLQPADLSLLQVDIHSHLIPRIDDGSQSMEDTMLLLRRFVEMGYRKVITTPHVMSDYYRNTPEIILAGLEEVRSVIKAEKLDISIDAAAEYYLDDMFETLLEKDEVLTFGQKKYLLFELPFVAEPVNLNRAIFNMQLKGYKPVLAHPERYGFWTRDLGKFKELHEKGVILQLNLNSLSGYYGPEAKKIADHLVSESLVGMIGTDCHRMDHLDIYENITRKTPGLHRLIDGGTLLNSSLL